MLNCEYINENDEYLRTCKQSGKKLLLLNGHKSSLKSRRDVPYEESVGKSCRNDLQYRQDMLSNVFTRHQSAVGATNAE